MNVQALVEAAHRPVIRRVLGVAVVLALIGAGAVTGSIAGTATAGPARVGVPVPSEQVAMIAQAALSCPSLTPARLAGQVMAESGFRTDAANGRGGSGLAGLTDQVWEQWKPWVDAQRLDPEANVFALAHYMCDTVGRIRHEDVGGALWELALGAHRSGVDTVLARAAVPDDSAAYVNEVASYAAWYAARPDFATGEPANPPAQDPDVAPVPVPDEYVQLVRTAGEECPVVSGPRIAAQLMAASAFNRNKVGPGDAQGIAQFLPAVWNRYGQAGESPWDPAVAILTLGRTMCALSAELSGLADDPYPVALAAFQWGPTAIRQAEGVPDAPAVRDFAQRVLGYTAYYAQDTRLTPPAAPQPPAATATAAPTATAATPSPRPVTTRSPQGNVAAPPPEEDDGTAAPPPANPPANTGPAQYQIKGYADKCIDAPKAADGVALQLWTCTGGASQKFTFENGTIRHKGFCMDLAWGESADGTRIQLAKCNGGWAQRFKINGAQDLVNTELGKCVDVVDWNDANGAVLQLWACEGQTNQKWWAS
ncbi:ricin-type beta-trefoil lectin domain protein [Catenuloplanes indicus]|uniref:Ferredoxin n=1 Tax=Catenuloplanes indicus TaxID=137267 RepID=A0AAE4AW00_9ACTN|nr:ricin-type beta-trefoil lectin domain protein [Catenuloplanes indicus]MDQ0364504.1 ferredoxin [Catenuloplanes indicus]